MTVSDTSHPNAVAGGSAIAAVCCWWRTHSQHTDQTWNSCGADARQRY